MTETIDHPGVIRLPDIYSSRNRNNLGTVAFIGWGRHFGPETPYRAASRLKIMTSSGRVIVGLRPDSPNRVIAREGGFSERNGNLLDTDDALEQADITIVSVPDRTLLANPELLRNTNPDGLVIGLSGLLKCIAEVQPAYQHLRMINAGIFPKGLCGSLPYPYASYSKEGMTNKQVKTLYQVTGLLGAPFAFQTTHRAEYRSDLLAEGGLLIGGTLSMCESLYRSMIARGASKEDAHHNTFANLAGPVARTIATRGILGLYMHLNGAEQQEFQRIFNATYPKLRELATEIYSKLSSTDGLAEVGKAIVEDPSQIDENVTVPPTYDKGMRRLTRISDRPSVVVSALYSALHLAQTDVLAQNGHSWVEIISELQEAIDAHSRYALCGLSSIYSSTASTIASVWKPRYDEVFSNLLGCGFEEASQRPFDSFLSNPVHELLVEFKERMNLRYV